MIGVEDLLSLEQGQLFFCRKNNVYRDEDVLCDINQKLGFLEGFKVIFSRHSLYDLFNVGEYLTDVFLEDKARMTMYLVC